MPNGCHRSTGFTLIELVAVLVIVGVLAIGAAASIGSYKSSHSAAAAAAIARDCQTAQNWASATGLDTWVVFDAADDQWSVVSTTNAGGYDASGAQDVALGNQPLRGTLATWGTIGFAQIDCDGGAVLGFDWFGRPMTPTRVFLTESATISLTTGQTVRIAPQSGIVTWDGG